jgi:FkbM family methyltransferase
MAGPMKNTPADAFELTASDRWAARFHRAQRWCRRRRWSKPLASLPWVGFMTALVVSNPVVAGRDIGRALGRFWLWHIWRRTVRQPVVVRADDGWSVVLPAWSKLGGITVAAGMHEPREELFVARFVRAGVVVVDVGANIGLYTAIASTRGARVFAFEPSTQARQALEATVAANRGGTVEIVPAALGDTPGMLSLTVGLDVANHLVESAGQPGVEPVEVLPLDQLTSGPHVRIPGPVTLLKIDAEGFDDRVLAGAEATITRDRPVAIVETWGDEVIRAWLEDHGYSVYRYQFETGELLEYPRPWNRQANFIAVHADALPMVRERLLAAGRALPRLPEVVWGPRASSS